MNVSSTIIAFLPHSARRRARRLRGAVVGTAMRGRRVHCPVCGGTFRRFLTFRGRPDAACPRCESLERHRESVRVCRERLGLFTDHLRVLHVAPEPGIEGLLRALPNLDYVSGDIDAGHADSVVDLTAIDAADASFDVILCSHVLEHVVDDRAAMAEIRRVLRPDGVALLEVPCDPQEPDVYEDPSITAPAERAAAFGQFDHVRLYGRHGFENRLHAAGLTVEVLSPASNGAWASENLAVLARPVPRR